MNKDFEIAGEEISASFAALRRDMSKLVEAMSALAQNQTRTAGDQFAETVGDATARVSATGAEAARRVGAAGCEMEACVERNPLTTALVAFGVGVSLGMLTRKLG